MCRFIDWNVRQFQTDKLEHFKKHNRRRWPNILYKAAQKSINRLDIVENRLIRNKDVIEIIYLLTLESELIPKPKAYQMHIKLHKLKVIKSVRIIIRKELNRYISSFTRQSTFTKRNKSNKAYNRQEHEKVLIKVTLANEKRNPQPA